MSIDFGKGLIAAIVREGYKEFLKRNFDIDILTKEDSFILKEIKEHYENYKTTPSFEVIEEITQVPLRNIPIEPLDFWIANYKKIFLLNHMRNYFEKISEFVNTNDTENFYTKCGEAFTYFKQSNQKTEDELLFSSTRFNENMEEIWNGSKTIRTPWPSLDNRLQGGYRPAELTCFAARPGVGKTNVLLLSALESWKQDKKVLIIGTEMSVKAMQIRAMFFAKMHDSLGKLRRGMITRDVKDWLVKFQEELVNKEKIRIVAGDFDATVDEVEAKIISFEPEILFIDGVYLMKSEKKEKFVDKHQRIAAVFDKLKGIAKYYDIPIAVSSQLNRGGKGKADQKTDLDRLAFSDNVGMVTDNTIYLSQDDNLKSQKRMCFEMGKLREGDCFDDVIVNWDFDNNNFTETGASEYVRKTEPIPQQKPKIQAQPKKGWTTSYKDEE